MGDYDMFRTTLMGGFDKDDVIRQFQELKENQYKEKTRLEKELKERDEQLSELSKRLKLKEVQRERLEKEISDKYQKYIDNYDSISGLVFDAKVQANQMLEEAIKKRDEILKEADQEANQRLDEAEESARHQAEEADCKAEAERAAAGFASVSEEIDLKRRRQDELKAACAQSSVAQEEDRLRSGRERLLKEQRNLLLQLRNTAQEIKREAISLLPLSRLRRLPPNLWGQFGRYPTSWRRCSTA